MPYFLFLLAVLFVVWIAGLFSSPSPTEVEPVGPVVQPVLPQDGVPTRIYGSLSACLDDAHAMADVDLCRETYAAAEAKMESAAPRHNEIATCEASYGAGNCVQKTDGHGQSWFMPALTGFMIGRMMDGGRSVTYADPIWRDRVGTAFSPTYGQLGIPAETDRKRQDNTVYSANMPHGGGGAAFASQPYGGHGWVSTSRGSSGSPVASISGAGKSGGAVAATSSVSRGGFGSTGGSHGSVGG